MDHKESATNSSASTSVSDGSSKFAHNSTPLQTNRHKSYDAVSSSLGKVDATATRPCAIIGPDRVLPPNTDDALYLKRMASEAWPSPENIYRRPPDYPSRISDYQPTRNISPRQTFQENMQRIMVPPTFSSVKSSDDSSIKITKLNMPQEAKYSDVPYNVNSVNNEQKSVRNSDIPLSNVNPSYARNMPPSYGWPAGVNVRPLRPYCAPEFYQYQDFPSCSGPRPMTMVPPHRALHEENAQMYSERLYQDANIRFKPYTTGKEKHQQQRYDYINNYPNTFHPPTSLPPHKYDLQKPIHGHPYPVYPQVPFKYLDRRIHEPFVDGYHRSHNQQPSFNVFHNQVVPPPYGPLPGNCLQNKSYSDISSKSMTVNKLQFENNNKVYLNLESRNKNYPVSENLYYNDINHSQAIRSDILLPPHPLNIHPMSQHSIYRKDNNTLKSYDYNPNYRGFDQSVNVNHSLQRLSMQFSPNALAISPSDSSTSNDTLHAIGASPQDDYGYVSQSSTASIKSLESGNVPISNDIFRRHYNNYDIIRNTLHPNGPIQTHTNKTNHSNKKNLNVRQFLQMWNEGDEEMSDSSKEMAIQNHTNNLSSQKENIKSQEQLYVLGLVNVPNEELDKYDHIQKISKLPENIKGYNSLEILNQYEELLETPHSNNYNKLSISKEYSSLKNLTDKEIKIKLNRPISPLDVEAKISQSVIHKEVGCNFEIKPCSPQMLNVEVAAPVQTILDERMIEKVINPLMTKSPSLARSETIKTQNTISDTIKIASCQMMSSNRYTSDSTSNKITSSNYCVQDLESNSGVCLASLPQLDNDIELNFPEINQQFIKANQIESSMTSSLQNLPHLDLEQTNNSFTHDIKSNSQNSVTPQLPLGPASDKEFLKLSKYRKSKKGEFTSSINILKQDIKSDASSVVQRIDSVIIKNPDNTKSQDIDSVKITDELHVDFKADNHEHSYSPSKCEINVERHEFSSDTAIDFSINRTENETVTSFLNEIHRKPNEELLRIEDLNQGNETSFICDKRLQNSETKLNNTVSCHQIEEHQNAMSKVLEDHKKYKEEPYKNHEFVEKNYKSSMIIPIKSSNIDTVNEENNLQVIKKSEISIIENEIYNNTENIRLLDSSSSTKVENTNSMCKKWENENFVTNPNITSQSESNMDIEEIKYESIVEKKNNVLSNTVKADEIDNLNMTPVNNVNQDKSKEINKIKVLEPSCTTKTSVVDHNETIEILKNVPNQNIDSLCSNDDIPYNSTENNLQELSKEMEYSDNKYLSDITPVICSTKKDLFKLPIVVEDNRVLEKDIGPAEADFTYALQSVVSLPNIFDIECDANIKQQDQIYNQEQICKESADVTSSQAVTQPLYEMYTETSNYEKESNILEVFTPDVIVKTSLFLMNERKFSGLSSETNKWNHKIKINSTRDLPEKTCKMSLDKSELISLSNKNDVNCVMNANFPNDTDAESLEKGTTKLVASDLTINNVENEKSSFMGEIKSSSVESKHEIDVEVKENNNIVNTDQTESQCLSNKSETNPYNIINDKNNVTLKSSLKNFKCKQEVEKNDNDGKISSGMPTDIQYNVNTCEINCKTMYFKVEGDRLESNKDQKYLNKKYTCFKKELFSPTIQKLLVFTEGVCNTFENVNTDLQNDCFGIIKDTPIVAEKFNDLMKNDNVDVFKQQIEVMNHESLDSDKEAKLLNEKDTVNNFEHEPYISIYVTSSKTKDEEKQAIKPGNENLKQKYNINKETSKISSSDIDSFAVLKPQKICKRSLSESALEGYKNNDTNILQPCKRKKGNQNFMGSHMITQDICNIIHTNRRNSISTFYSEDDVYIVIDNDLILAEANDDSEKICFTEIAEGYATSLESTYCDANHILTTDLSSDEQNDQFCEYDSLSGSFEIEKPTEDSWVEDVACIETVLSEDVAENIVIDVQTSPKINDNLDLESINEESSGFYDSNHIDKIKTIYGSTICNDNTQLIETLYRTPQMNVNKTLYHVESEDSVEYSSRFDSNDAIQTNHLKSNEDILETEVCSYKVMDDKENISENLSLSSEQCSLNIYQNSPSDDVNDSEVFSAGEEDKYITNPCESSNDFLTSSVQTENSPYSCSSSPEVSSTTSEEKNSSILLKITNCNGSRVSRITDINSEVCNKLSYKLTEKREYYNYNTNFNSSRTLITKAAQKYIPPLKESLYDLKVKLPLPQHRLHILKQLKTVKVESKPTATKNHYTSKNLKQDICKKQKPKFEDVLKSIDEINFKRHKDKIKKGKNSIPKVVIKKNENGAHYTSSKITNRKETYNPDLTGRKWQPWVFLEKNSFIDGMVLQNKVKAVYCHRKNSYVLAEKFRKYKSIYNANFVISQPRSDTKGNLKYTIRLKQS